MVNYMAEVAKMLGVEMNEDFKCNENNYTYRFTDRGFTCNGFYGGDSLMMILDGELTIKHKLWKPGIGCGYWTVMRDGSVCFALWFDGIFDINFYKIGNCYRTKEEAELNSEKWIAFYASDEVLEV